MKHMIMGIPKNEDFPTFELKLVIPTEKLSALMGWQNENDWMFDYQLTLKQITEIERLIPQKLPVDLDLFLTY